MKLDVVIVKFIDVKIPYNELARFRGYIGNEFKDIVEAHNHTSSGYVYSYPKIQYKMVDGVPAIVGIGDCVDLVLDIEKRIERILIGDTEFNNLHREIIRKECEFGCTDKAIVYEFDSPWMALNQKNAKEYAKKDDFEKIAFLEKILVGNIISCSKGLGYKVDKQVKARIDVDSMNVKFKKNDMSAFKGAFMINFEIPEWFGLGKSCSRGFGSIKRIG